MINAKIVHTDDNWTDAYGVVNALKKQTNVVDNDFDIMIVASFGWQKINRAQHRRIDKPKALIGYKEYRFLDEQIKFCYDTDTKYFFTWCPAVDQLNDKYPGIEFIYLPFGADETLHKDYNEPKLFDISFLGHIHDTQLDRFQGFNEQYTNIRRRSLDHLLTLEGINKGVPDIVKTRGFNRTVEFLEGERYARRLNQSKIWLNTVAAWGALSPRYFECMGSETLIFTHESHTYTGVLNKNNCVTYNLDLSDFEDKLRYYLEHSDERNKIIAQAKKDFLTSHTWGHRARKVLEVLL